MDHGNAKCWRKGRWEGWATLFAFPLGGTEIAPVAQDYEFAGTRQSALFNDTAAILNYLDLIVAKENLEKIYEYKTKGAILRSKNRQYKDGEKNLKYLKRYFKRKVIGQLRRADNTTLTTDNQECVDFYSELYGSRPVHNGIDNFELFPDKNTV